MNTSTESHKTTSESGLTFWKILGIIAVALIALAMIGPILKGLFWVALIALAIYGGAMLFRSSRKKSGPTPPSGF
ncbi:MULTISPECIES: hypothetical protein [unclassified Gordonia (in: high G+C Gram-positive bacteria)]|uniref:hypothetical protein n=1 Tax=Gordonia sp. VNQ95 TaxID=3156619 RepID=UPI0032B5F938